MSIRMLGRTAAVAVLFLLAAAGAVVVGAEEENRREGPLVVFSDDFMFSVKEPKGWTADIENAPKLSAGIVFYQQAESFEKRGTTISIRISKKVDEDTAKDLAHDMEQFRSLYPDVEFLPLKAVRKGYKTFAKLFAIRNSSYHYLCYVNPGKDAPYLFVVFMEKQKKKAEDKELKAFREIVKTLDWLPKEEGKQRESSPRP